MDAPLIDTTEIEAILREYAEDVAERYKARLHGSDHYASGALEDSITARVQVGENWWEARLSLLDYWKWLENGSAPHWPPRDAILRWIEVKPVIPRPDASGRIPSPRQLAFLIARAMAGKSPNQPNLKNPLGGTTGTHDLAKTKDDITPFYRERIAAAFGKIVGEYIRKVFA
jgi:hypothetical protein